MISDASLGWILALGGHVLVGVLSPHTRPSPVTEPAPIEVLLEAPPPQKAPATEPPKEPEPAVAAPAPLPQASRASVAPVARAGALVTARESTSEDGTQLADFMHDPSALGFGSGTVAVGGTARQGLGEARVQEPSAAIVAPPANGDEFIPASDLSEQPRLGESDPCRGFFPKTASDDVATATVAVTLARDGRVTGVSLVSEDPAQQGFGNAARACMSSKRFRPGRDRNGNPAATRLRVHVRFTR